MKNKMLLAIAAVLMSLMCAKVDADIAADLDTIVVTATRIAQHNYKIAGNVTVIDRDQIQASNARNVPDLLKEAMGAYVFDKNTAKTAVVDLRGFGDSATSNVLVLVNDRKINSIDISGADLLQIPIESVERVEIVRGAGSVLYGDNAVGGVVNIITKKGAGDLKGRVGGAYGSYDTRGTDLEVSGGKNDLSYFFYSQYFDQRGYRQNSDVLSQDFSTRLGYDFSDAVGVDFNFGRHHDRSGLPGGLSGAEIETLGRRDTTEPENYSTTLDEYYNLSFDLDPWGEDLTLGGFVLDLSYRDREVFDTFFGSGTDRSIRTKGVTGKYIFDQEVFGREVNFVTGVDYYDHENDILGRGGNTVDLTISKGEFGPYGFMQYEMVDGVFVNAGTRWHKASYAFSQRDVVVDEKQRPEESVSMAGIKYEYGQGSTAHMNVQQTFRFLATDEWYNSSNYPDFGITPSLNTSLKQQTGVQYEAGVRHNFNDKVIVSVTPYWLDIKDEIFFDPVGFINSNYDKTRRMGVEFGSETDVLKFFDLGFFDDLRYLANYTYQQPQFRDGANDGKDIPIVPRHQASTGLTARFFEHVQLSLLGRFVGSRYAINDVQNAADPIKPHFLLDGKLAYQRDAWKVYFGINNLLDEQYYSYAAKSAFSSAKDYYPAPERNYNLGVEWEF